MVFSARAYPGRIFLFVDECLDFDAVVAYSSAGSSAPSSVQPGLCLS